MFLPILSREALWAESIWATAARIVGGPVVSRTMCCMYGVVVYCAVWGFTIWCAWAVWCNVVLCGTAHGGVLYFVTCFIQYDVLRCGIFWYYVVCGILWCMFCVVSMSTYTCLRVWCAIWCGGVVCGILWYWVVSCGILWFCVVSCVYGVVPCGRVLCVVYHTAWSCGRILTHGLLFTELNESIINPYWKADRFGL